MKTYLVRHNDLSTRLKSRSGAFFISLSDYVFARNGVVYGTVLENNRVAHFLRAETIEDRDAMCGSKYIQSRVLNAMIEAKKDLDDGRLVLFTGTPCQIAGFLNYLKPKQYDNLVTADIICHGVPSEKIWQDLLQSVEKEHKQKVKDISFRNKYIFGWKDHVETFELENGEIIFSKRFVKLFYDHIIIRPSCYTCHFKTLNRCSDFTFGDAWQSSPINEEEAKSFTDDNGVSIILVNDKKAETIFDELKNIEKNPADIAHFTQPTLKMNWPCPKERKKFWKIYKKKGLLAAERKNEFWTKCHKIKSIWRKMFKK